MTKITLKDEYKISRLQRAALAEVELLKHEFELIVEHTRKQKSISLFDEIDFVDFTDSDIKDIFTKRKDRKYASLTVELYAITEQMLKEMYECLHSDPYSKSNDNNIIKDLEDVLKSRLVINEKGSLKKLSMLRNYIIHHNFSMKKAREEKELNIKSKDLYSELHQKVVDYINNISYKE
ncbi:hypothetical protein [Paenibacillus donghaensis]|uniref:Uncharacterized protein n=1 Tax=Paenibacillus donghaensis TaxID=414771 RepID=A0A2Z2KRY9_9BACL|nr:hypothetical protein [Paenibacillus donghaensis]ASA24292.1 hypothetical protein B9T62_28130 [Paenibacillus donghaensis]